MSDRPNLVDLSPFGMWTVQSYSEKRNRKHYWMCVCKCGKQKDVAESDLLNGSSTGCGCNRKITRKHGHIHLRNQSPEYMAFFTMRKHGMIHPEWKTASGFLSFLDHVGKKPGANYNLRRIVPSKGFVPGNVRWVKVASKTVPVIIFHNQKVTVKELASRAEMSPSTVRKMAMRGLSGQEIWDSRPTNCTFLTIGSDTLSLKEWFVKLNASKSTYYHYKRFGLSSDRAMLLAAREIQ